MERTVLGGTVATGGLPALAVAGGERAVGSGDTRATGVLLPVVAVEVVAPNVKTVRRGATGVLAEVEASGRNVDETGKDRCCVRGPALRRGAG